MCNPAFTDGVREQVARLLSHTNELRLKFSEAEASHQEGNLSNEILNELNRAIHSLEEDASVFEKLLEELA